MLVEYLHVFNMFILIPVQFLQCNNIIKSFITIINKTLKNIIIIIKVRLH